MNLNEITAKVKELSSKSSDFGESDEDPILSYRGRVETNMWRH